MRNNGRKNNGRKSKGIARWVRRALCATVAGFGFSLPALADYSQHPLAGAFVDEMVKQHGFRRDEVTAWLRDAERQQSVLDAIARPAEKAKPWKEYRRLFVTADRIQPGLAFWRENAQTLARAERVSGVPAAIVVAIIGVETRYGRQAGRYRVLDALATLSFDYAPRADFFRTQLVEYLLMAREQQFAPDSMLGSYAGAMGFGQFMPNSFRKYAVDFDGDGHIDIVNDVEDAIGSVANYLKEHGWQRGGPIVTPARVPDPLPEGLLRKSLEPVTTLAEYKRRNIAGAAPLPDSTPAALFMLEGDSGSEYWLGLNNFYVITRYNPSQMYAMAVVQLSEEIASKWSY